MNVLINVLLNQSLHVNSMFDIDIGIYLPGYCNWTKTFSSIFESTLFFSWSLFLFPLSLGKEHNKQLMYYFIGKKFDGEK